MRIIHWRMLRLKTGKLPRYAAAVGSDLLVGDDGAEAGAPVNQRAAATYARRWVSTMSACSVFVRVDQSLPSGVDRAPDSNSPISSAIGRAGRCHRHDTFASGSYHDSKIRTKIHCVQR